MDDEQSLQGIFRQRRNFLLVSALLAAFIFLDIEFSEIQVFGVKFILRNKANLLWVVFAWWLYFFWRYYQYHAALRDHQVSRGYYAVVERFANSFIARAAKKAYPDCLNPHQARFGEMKPASLLRSSYPGQLAYRSSNPNLNEARPSPFEVSRLWFLLCYVVAVPVVIYSDHHVSDYLLPYALGVFLGIVFLAQVAYA